MFANALHPWHLLLVALAFILLFGSKKLPDAARALGTSMRILKSEAEAMKAEGVQQRDTPSTPPASGPRDFTG
ncbi:Sec-independent protein translocase subunit TatA [Streptomyces griseus]|uniref:Sec-independent protein translocase subunit TatA n=1 Tax=Streptomyces griseus TaxID=1911 RepID=UPI00084017AE|nr:Sec-independent protein translocase subunit TatA [Streptomyces griseus]